MKERIENALEWVLTGSEHKAVDFIIVVIVFLAMAYMAAQVLRWAL